MISKFYEINKYKNKLKLYLFYGDNEGLKLETIQSNFENFNKENTYKYNEKDIIANKEIFFNNVYSKSFFEDKKLVLISDVTDKFLNLVEDISESDHDVAQEVDDDGEDLFRLLKKIMMAGR